MGNREVFLQSLPDVRLPSTARTARPCRAPTTIAPGGIATARCVLPFRSRREHQNREPAMNAANPLPFTAWHLQRSPVQAWAWQTRGFNIQARHLTEVRHAVDPLQRRRASPPSSSACLLWVERGHIVIKSAPGSATARDIVLRRIRTIAVTSSSRQGVSS